MTIRIAALATMAQSHKAALAAVLAMAIKGCGALLTLAVFTAAARAMTASDFGRLAIWFNAMSFLAVAAAIGQDTLIARSWGEYHGRGETDLAYGAYRFGWTATCVSALAFAVAVYIFAPFMDPGAASSVTLAAALFLFAQTTLHYSSHSTRVIVGFVESEIGRDVIWRVMLMIVVVWAAFQGGISPAQFFAAAAAGMTLSLIYQIREVRKKLAVEPKYASRQDDRPEWLRRSGAMWLSAVVEAASQYADVMLIGYFASPAVAGGYFVAARIANVFIMVMTGLNTYSYAHSARLYFSGQTQKLQEILRSLVVVGTAMLTPCLALIFVYGAEILSLFGDRYAQIYPTLIVLSTACFIMSLAGSASVILLTTGHEQIYSRVITAATGLRVILTALLAAKFGAFGAACGWALVNAPLFMALSFVCSRLCGVDPSILSVFRRRDRHSTNAQAHDSFVKSGPVL